MKTKNGVLTPVQIRDKIIEDLRTQLSNEKNAHRNDMELFDYKRAEFTKDIIQKQNTIQLLQHEILILTQDNNAKKEEIQELKKKIAELDDKIAVLESRMKKNSTNSSKPSSSNPYEKPRTSSTRGNSGKKAGGQKGHKGYTINLEGFEKESVDIKEGACSCGGEIEFSDEYQTRKIFDFKIIMKVKEQRAHSGVCKNCKKPFQSPFSDDFTAPVKYGDNIKAIVAMLNEYGNVPDKKTAEIVSSLCGDKINMSTGTVVNIRTSLAAKMASAVEVIKQNLTKSGILCVDETGLRVNGKLDWTSIFANDQYTLFEHNKKRSAHCNDEDGILALYTGILVHDHFKAYYKNKVATHAECNQHILRYLKAVIEIQGHQWANKMTEFLLNAKKLKTERISSGYNCFTQQELAEQEQNYISILDEGDKEYQAAIKGLKRIKRFNEERCLLARLREYKDEHLRFISDFDSPFGNNCAEQGAHFIKNKTRVAGGFRSEEGADNHMVIASVITSAKKQKKNIISVIKDSFKGNQLFDSG
jgi:transposase